MPRLEQPKTDHVRTQIVRAILRGEYAPGDRIPTERDLAVRTGTSRITIRRAYSELERAGVLERTQGRGTHVATRIRGHSTRTDFVALLATVRDPFMLGFVQALEAALARSGGLLVLKITDEDPRREEEAAIDLVTRGIHNLVVWPSGRGCPLETFRRLRILGTNLVFFDRVLPGTSADYVGLDNRHAVRLLLDHAQARGLREAIFVSHDGLGADSDRQREEAFAAECERRSMPAQVVRVPWKGDIESAVHRSQSEWFGGRTRVALVCVNDHVALAVRQATAGRLPVYGIDGLPAVLAAGIPTCVQPMAAMAARAIRCLADQQQQGLAWQARVIYCRGRLFAS